MATGNQITIWSGAGLIDTEVILKPVDEDVETGYVAEYLTHGMPVIEIIHSGEVLETYPARLQDVYSIRVVRR